MIYLSKRIFVIFTILLMPATAFSQSGSAISREKMDAILAQEAALNDIKAPPITAEPNNFADINGDGFIDSVVLIEFEPQNEQEQRSIFMAIFVGRADGKFTFYKASGDTLQHVRVSQDVEIRDRSIYLTRNVWAPNGGSEELFQFRIRKDEIVLIGCEISAFENDGTSAGVSINFLTQKKASWTQEKTGKKWKKEIYKSGNKLIKFDEFHYLPFKL